MRGAVPLHECGDWWLAIQTGLALVDGFSNLQMSGSTAGNAFGGCDAVGSLNPVQLVPLLGCFPGIPIRPQ